MKAHIRHIGVIDKHSYQHCVTLTEGVNVITGKSSTGKSSLLDIFDYCFGASQFAQLGFINDSSSICFTVIKLERTCLVLARKKSDPKRAFLKEEQAVNIYEYRELLTEEYFQDAYWVSLDGVFKKNLGRYFNLTLTSVDEENNTAKWRNNNSKLASPSIRSFSSFLLQNQNLIANKYALFYRFDNDNKKEQAMNHFKYFVGFVDPNYYTLQQQLDALRISKKQVEQNIKRAEQKEESFEKELNELLAQYKATCGEDLPLGGIKHLLKSPKLVLEELSNLPIKIKDNSSEYEKIKREYERSKAQHEAHVRKLASKLADIKESITIAESFIGKDGSARIPSALELHAAECPFCKSGTPELFEAANSLSEAIQWLNERLLQSHFMKESLEEEKLTTENELGKEKNKIADIVRVLEELEKHTKQLELYKTQHEVALKIKLKIELLIENSFEIQKAKLIEQFNELTKEIARVQSIIFNEYDIAKKTKNAEEYLSTVMAEIGNKFDFERYFKPINLHFSFERFSLWHENPNGSKVPLGTMGSGANWLYCHVTLFLALQQFFCTLGEKCLIPSFLFLDQPSQVYFPRTDYGESFNALELVDAKKELLHEKVDEDLLSVQNLYTELVDFCNRTYNKTGIKPQIIVTDHADHLELGNGHAFEDLVKARWRKEHEAFIDTSLWKEHTELD